MRVVRPSAAWRLSSPALLRLRPAAPRPLLIRAVAARRHFSADATPRTPSSDIHTSYTTRLASSQPALGLGSATRAAGSGRGDAAAGRTRCSASSSTSTTASTSTATATGVELPAKWAGLSEEEILRRKRISEANRGKQPWNKGRKHSEATKAKIRARTREAMQRPEVLEKLRNMPHPKHNEHIRRKISASLKVFYAGRRPTSEERQAVAAKKAVERAAKAQAKAAAKAQTKAKAQVKAKAKEKTAVVRVQSEKVTPAKKKAAKPAKRASAATRSEEHKRKIAEAIKRKWQDPNYRTKIITKMTSEEVQARRTKKYRKAIADNHVQNFKRIEAQRLVEQRAHMKSTAAQLVAKGERTVQKLEEQVEALREHPTVQMRAQTALANARGVLKKAQVQMAQIEMELTLAAELEEYTAGDEGETGEESWDEDSDDEDEEEVGSGVGSNGARGVNGARLNGGRPRNLGDGSIAMNGHKLESHRAGQEMVNGRNLEVNGHNGTHSASSAWLGTPEVDGQRVEAAVQSMNAHPHSANRASTLVNNGLAAGRGGGGRGGPADSSGAVEGLTGGTQAGRGGARGRGTTNGSHLLPRRKPTDSADDL